MNMRQKAIPSVILVLTLLLGGRQLYAEEPEYKLYLPSLERGLPCIDETPYHEETSPSIQWTGDWAREENSLASGGSYRISHTPGDQVGVCFKGTSISWIRMIQPAAGSVSVSIDGVHRGTIDLAFQEERWQVPTIFENLDDGWHQLILTVITAPVVVDAFSTPSDHPHSTDQWRALERVNYHRQWAGLSPVAMSQALNLAAQSHANFLMEHSWHPLLAGLGSHIAPPELSGFIGKTPYERSRYFGFLGFSGEGLTGGGPQASTDGLVSAPYHRLSILDYHATVMGSGFRSDPINNNQAVVVLGGEAPMLPQQRTIITYPGPNQVEVPPAWDGNELPDPLPDISHPVGYPISLHIFHPDVTGRLGIPPTVKTDSWRVDSYQLQNSSGQTIAVRLLHRDTDPNRRLSADVLFLISESPLASAEVYTVRITGIDSRGDAFDISWQFTTKDVSPNKCDTVPILVYPTNDANTGTLRMRVEWFLDDNPFVTELRLQVSRDPSFREIRPGLTYHNPRPGEGHFEFNGNFPPSTAYYWRAYVTCQNQKGPYSEVAAFTTGAHGVVLPAPTPLAPAENSQLNGTSARLAWTPVEGATEYLVMFRTDGFGWTPFWLTGTETTIGYLQPTSRYEWTVSSANKYAYSVASPISHFVTGSESD